MTTRSRSFVPLLIAFVLALPSCEKKEASPPESHQAADAGALAAPGVDKDIVDAVEAVAGGGAVKGPPPSGVFASPALADKEIRAGEPPKLSVGSKGKGPTIQFGAPAKPEKRLTGNVEISVQTGPRSALPTMDLTLTFEPEGKPEPDATTPVAMEGKVTSAKLAANQPGELPAGLDKQVEKAKGSVLKYEFEKNGSGRPLGFAASKGLDDSFSPVLGAASDAFSVAFLPLPAEPVGEGAFWMVKSRETFAGLDVVVYRMMKLEKIDGGRAVISVNAKRFVAGGKLAFAGLPPHHLTKFSGNGQGKIDVSAANPSDVHGELDDVLIAGLEPEGALPQGMQQGQTMQVHLEMQARVSVGK